MMPYAPLCAACIVAGGFLGLLWWVPMGVLHIPLWACILVGAVAGVLAIGSWVFT